MDSDIATLEPLHVPSSSSSGESRFQAQKNEDLTKSGENYGENFCNSAGKKRRLTADQVHLLEKSFNAGNKLEHEMKLRLAEEMGLQPRQVAIWFQNRRARSKTKKMEIEFDSLNTEYDKLKKDYENLVKENQKLKAEVDELRGKWAATEMMKDPFGAVEAVDSSEFVELFNVQMGSCRNEEGSRSTSKSDGFYSESPAMENQTQSEFLQNEEDDFSKLGKLEDDLMGSYNIFVPAVSEDRSFCFWPC